MKKSISIFLGVQILIFIIYFYSLKIFLNVEIAFLSAFLIIVGSSFAYRKMVHSKIDTDQYENERDLLDRIDDPYELYDNQEVNQASAQELDLKQIVKEEKAKIKTFSVKNVKYGLRGSSSMIRITPYLFLVLGFIALKNNGLLELTYYLPSLFIGIVTGAIISKEIFA